MEPAAAGDGGLPRQTRNQMTLEDGQLRNQMTLEDSQLRNQMTLEDSRLRNQMTLEDSQLRNQMTLEDSQLRNQMTLEDSQLRNQMTLEDSQLDAVLHACTTCRATGRKSQSHTCVPTADVTRILPETENLHIRAAVLTVSP
jgi:alkyl sulfatase BDS1-like metallo-beta-lactamase superfamily hydrolase